MADEFKNIKLRAKNYKCFGADPCGFEEIRLINLIIGKNNTGKSALLDVVEFAANPHRVFDGRSGKPAEIFLTNLLSEADIRSVFSSGTNGGGVPGANFYEYGKQWINKSITVSIQKGGGMEFAEINPPMEVPATNPNGNQFRVGLTNLVKIPFRTKKFARIAADRDIVPERSSNNLNISETGASATNVIQTFINHKHRNRSLIDRDLRLALNSIFEPDATFNSISARLDDNESWEIYLEEEKKGYVPLSASGSGLKTIMLVLLNTILRPSYENTDPGSYMFAFEELENNLHPALQRKLLLYIREFAVKTGATFFITTHSNVVIDLFSRDEEAQILHVTNDGSQVSVKKIQTYLETKGVLDDLDFRASDLLQSNGVIWVEGPSDRAYINKWIDLFTGGTLKEGVHYQCAFYGGKLLSHLSADLPKDVDEAVSVLRMNQNAIILMDSDKKSGTDTINLTKQRIIKELESNGLFAWVTQGREIENYIPPEVFQKVYGVPSDSTLGDYQNVWEYLNTIVPGRGDGYRSKKVNFTGVVLPHLTRENLSAHLDMKEKMYEVTRRICGWNRLSQTEL